MASDGSFTLVSPGYRPAAGRLAFTIGAQLVAEMTDDDLAQSWQAAGELSARESAELSEAAALHLIELLEDGLPAADIADAGLQQGLGDREDAFAAEFVAGAKFEIADFFGKGPFSHGGLRDRLHHLSNYPARRFVPSGKAPTGHATPDILNLKQFPGRRKPFAPPGRPP